MRQIAVRPVEPLVLDPTPYDNEIAIVKLLKYKSIGDEQILAEVIQAENDTFVVLDP
jgi:hypothetical protein